MKSTVLLSADTIADTSAVAVLAEAEVAETTAVVLAEAEEDAGDALVATMLAEADASARTVSVGARATAHDGMTAGNTTNAMRSTPINHSVVFFLCAISFSIIDELSGPHSRCRSVVQQHSPHADLYAFRRFCGTVSRISSPTEALSCTTTFMQS